MRKKLIGTAQQDKISHEQEWLNLEPLVSVELTSEDDLYPIESVLIAEQSSGWRAAVSGKQKIRLLFDHPQHLKRIKLSFEEFDIERTQEFVLSWTSEHDKPLQEIVRQQWNFSPDGNNFEREDYQVDLLNVSVLELNITPDINGGEACASLMQLQLA